MLSYLEDTQITDALPLMANVSNNTFKLIKDCIWMSECRELEDRHSPTNPSNSHNCTKETISEIDETTMTYKIK